MTLHTILHWILCVCVVVKILLFLKLSAFYLLLGSSDKLHRITYIILVKTRSKSSHSLSGSTLVSLWDLSWDLTSTYMILVISLANSCSSAVHYVSCVPYVWQAAAPTVLATKKAWTLEVLSNIVIWRQCTTFFSVIWRFVNSPADWTLAHSYGNHLCMKAIRLSPGSWKKHQQYQLTLMNTSQFKSTILTF